MKPIVFFSLIFMSFLIHAEFINDVTIEDVRWYGSNHGYLTVSDRSNPGCPDALPSPHLYFNTDIPGHDKMFSLGLAALMSGKTVDVSVSGCNESGKHSLLSGVIVKR
jgi:hypothetical protein